MRTRPAPRVTAALVALSLGSAPAAARADDGLAKGPWLMDLRGDAVTVMAERADPGPLTVRAWPAGVPDGGDGDDGGGRGAGAGGDPRARAVSTTDREQVTLHELRLEGLSPGVRYRYEVRGPGVRTARGTFTTAPPPGTPFRFVLYGDTRSRQATHAAAVAAIRREAPDFVVHTGDLMEDGRSERQWQSFFEIERDLLSDAPFLPVIGNHEIFRRESNGIENFRRYVHADPDTPSPELDYTFAYGSVRFVLGNAFDDWDDPQHLAWLDNALARARAEVPDGFVIVVMHQGVCSCGPHGESQRLRRAGVDEMMRRRGVDLLVSGHDHFYERGEDRGLRYLVTGGCGAPLYNRQHFRDYTITYDSEHHYVRADVEPGVITLTATRLDGSVLERCRLTHAGWDCPGGARAARRHDGVDGRESGGACEDESGGAGEGAVASTAGASSAVNVRGAARAAGNCGCRVGGRGAGGAPAGAGAAAAALAVLAALGQRRGRTRAHR